MRYYYLIFDDNVLENGRGFIVTFNNKQSIYRDKKGPWVTDKYEVVWAKRAPSDDYWMERVVSGGMATRRIFDSTKAEDRYRLIKAILNVDDGGFNI